jgi:hypothetical protein
MKENGGGIVLLPQGLFKGIKHMMKLTTHGFL